MPKRAKKISKSARIQSLLILTAGVICLTTFVGYKIHRANRMSFEQVPPVNTKANLAHSPESIEIIPLSIKLSVEPARVEGNRWEINEKGASYLVSSAPLKDNGNTVIYAHNKATMFGSLSQIKIGYPITLKTREGKIHSYSVYKIETVTPDRVDVIKSNGEEELTLYTCTGFADTKRLVVKAKPI